MQMKSWGKWGAAMLPEMNLAIIALAGCPPGSTLQTSLPIELQTKFVDSVLYADFVVKPREKQEQQFAQMMETWVEDLRNKADMPDQARHQQITKAQKQINDRSAAKAMLGL